MSITSRPPTCLTIMSWLNTESPGGRVEAHDLRALARERVDVARDVRHGLRVRRIGDVHDLHAAAAARGLVEHRQIGEVALGRDVGHTALAAELAAQVE